ncbi:MAG: nucleotidyltransferase domain-containing protein [Lachnospiraceae bacterium]|nr:nucleotidyltransferase domain-containing protein [Lachnospiraceae bacterium]MDD3794480.1 nucleotidyltransferase domain-containing protein [Lachnospiraceae bacterium]
MDQNVLTELVNGILKVMEHKIVKIVLYGSVARGTNTEESDVDIALLLLEDMDRETEEKLSDFIVDMNLKYDKVFSVIDINFDKFKKWEGVTPFYQNVNKEGVVLWKAA